MCTFVIIFGRSTVIGAVVLFFAVKMQEVAQMWHRELLKSPQTLIIRAFQLVRLVGLETTDTKGTSLAKAFIFRLFQNSVL